MPASTTSETVSPSRFAFTESRILVRIPTVTISSIYSSPSSCAIAVAGMITAPDTAAATASDRTLRSPLSTGPIVSSETKRSAECCFLTIWIPPAWSECVTLCNILKSALSRGNALHTYSFSEYVCMRFAHSGRPDSVQSGRSPGGTATGASAFRCAPLSWFLICFQRVCVASPPHPGALPASLAKRFEELHG